MDKETWGKINHVVGGIWQDGNSCIPYCGDYSELHMGHRKGRIAQLLKVLAEGKPPLLEIDTGCSTAINMEAQRDSDRKWFGDG